LDLICALPTAMVADEHHAMATTPKTVSDYLRSLSPERRTAISTVRKVIRAHLPEGYEEYLLYGMIGYAVPHQLYPAGYHCKPDLPLPYTLLGSQKNHMALHLMAVYGDKKLTEWFQTAWKATGKRLDMGKDCVRFKRVEDLPLEVIGQVIAKVPVKNYIAKVEAALQSRGRQVK
jgi:hypothetical protein